MFYFYFLVLSELVQPIRCNLPNISITKYCPVQSNLYNFCKSLQNLWLNNAYFPGSGSFPMEISKMSGMIAEHGMITSMIKCECAMPIRTSAGTSGYLAFHPLWMKCFIRHFLLDETHDEVWWIPTCWNILLISLFHPVYCNHFIHPSTTKNKEYWVLGIRRALIWTEKHFINVEIALNFDQVAKCSTFYGCTKCCITNNSRK